MIEARKTAWWQGDALALPCEDQSFDAAVMALVLFLPDPAQGLAEMKRVVRPGGAISGRPHWPHDLTGQVAVAA